MYQLKNARSAVYVAEKILSKLILNEQRMLFLFIYQNILSVYRKPFLRNLPLFTLKRFIFLLKTDNLVRKEVNESLFSFVIFVQRKMEVCVCSFFELMPRQNGVR